MNQDKVGFTNDKPIFSMPELQFDKPVSYICGSILKRMWIRR